MNRFCGHSALWWRTVLISIPVGAILLPSSLSPIQTSPDKSLWVQSFSLLICISIPHIQIYQSYHVHFWQNSFLQFLGALGNNAKFLNLNRRLCRVEPLLKALAPGCFCTCCLEAYSVLLLCPLFCFPHPVSTRNPILSQLTFRWFSKHGSNYKEPPLRRSLPSSLSSGQILLSRTTLSSHHSSTYCFVCNGLFSYLSSHHLVNTDVNFDPDCPPFAQLAKWNIQRHLIVLNKHLLS